MTTSRHLAAVSDPTTDALRVDDVVIFGGTRRVVAALTDTGRPAVFGTGTEWAIRLQDESGRRTDMAAATSQRWHRA